MGAISVAIDLLRKSSFFETAGDEEKEYLDLISISTVEGLRLIGDLLDMESIAAGKLSLETEEHCLDEIVRHSIKLLEPQARWIKSHL